MSKETEYLLVGSVPDLVKSFMKRHDLKPVTEYDATTFIVTGDASELKSRFTMVANLYTREETQVRDKIPGVYGDDVKAQVKEWANTPA
jgi:hypothetical protein